jgi:hypothetical protein
MKCLAFTLCLLCLSFGVQAQPASFQTRKLTDNVCVSATVATSRFSW